MAHKLMNIFNYDSQNYPSLDYNLWLKRLDTQLNEPTNQNSIKSPKLLSQQMRNVILL